MGEGGSFLPGIGRASYLEVQVIWRFPLAACRLFVDLFGLVLFLWFLPLPPISFSLEVPSVFLYIYFLVFVLFFRRFRFWILLFL